MRKAPSLEMTRRTVSAKQSRDEGPPNLCVIAFVCFVTDGTPGATKRQSTSMAFGNGYFWKAENENHSPRRFEDSLENVFQCMWCNRHIVYRHVIMRGFCQS